jgi:hypothetical protein
MSTAKQAARETLQRLYLFYVTDNKDFFYKVEVAKILPTLEAATTHAAIIASKLAEDDDWHGFEVAVKGNRGNEIVRIPIDPSKKRMRPSSSPKASGAVSNGSGRRPRALEG